MHFAGVCSGAEDAAEGTSTPHPGIRNYLYKIALINSCTKRATRVAQRLIRDQSKSRWGGHAHRTTNELQTEECTITVSYHVPAHRTMYQLMTRFSPWNCEITEEWRGSRTIFKYRVHTIKGIQIHALQPFVMTCTTQPHTVFNKHTHTHSTYTSRKHDTHTERVRETYQHRELNKHRPHSLTNPYTCTGTQNLSTPCTQHACL